MIQLQDFDAVIFDMDGVVTQTANVHAAAWKRLFDEFLQQRAEKEGTDFRPFDSDADYRKYVDGKSRYDGVESFLQSRGISLPRGEPDDPPEAETVCGLGNRKNSYFLAHLREQGAEAYGSTIGLIRSLKSNGLKTAIFSASKNCEEVLRAAGVLHLFDAKVDGIDAEELGLDGKPDPAVLLEASRRLGVEPRRSVIVEDAIAGVQAGRAGRFGLVIGVNRSADEGVLRDNGADVEVTDLSQVHIAGEGSSRDTRKLPSAIDSWGEIRSQVSGKKLAVFLDYDGTLTPIVEDPARAILSEEMRSTVSALAGLCTVAIISGRDLPDVRQHVGIDSVFYAGSHGFDLAGPDDWRSEYEGGSQFLPHLDEAEKDLVENLNIPGARVERKRFAIAVHYRQAQDEDVPAVERLVDRVLEDHPALRKTGGKKIFELRPDIEWDKGKALLWLLAELNLDASDVIPFYIGDDVTDEDAFRAIRDRGVGILVIDDQSETEAGYILESPAQVKDFLELIVKFLGEKS